jgi:tRNA(Ile)-lysidine synthase
LSPEEAARERRLAFLQDTARAVDADRIATGHTLDDQAETVLMRFLNGAGARGLSGIPPVREPFVRPLIDCTRDDVERFCKERKLEPRHDPTNDSTRFLRNALRREVIPALQQRVNSRLADALARAADLLREDDELLDRLSAEAIEIERTGHGARLDARALAALPVALQRRAVRRALGPPGVDAAHVDRILTLAREGKSGDALDLPLRLNARLEYGSLLIGRATSPAKVLEVPLLVPGRTPVPWADATLVVWLESTAPAEWPDGKTACVIDGDRLTEEPIVRTRRRGDRLAPLGMKGSKTVADLLSDDKVPRARRHEVPIVATRDAVVWVAGHRVAGAFKVTQHTKRFLWMTIEGGAAWRS